MELTGSLSILEGTGEREGEKRVSGSDDKEWRQKTPFRISSVVMWSKIPLTVDTLDSRVAGVPTMWAEPQLAEK